MVELTIKSIKTGKSVKASYTPRQLLDTDEESLVNEMTQCSCQPIGESYIRECNCDEEWEEYNLTIGK